MANQKSAAANIRTAIENGDIDAVRENLAILSMAKRLSKDAKSAAGEAAEWLAENDDSESEEGEYSMSGHMAKYRERYVKTKAPSGSSSMNNGDDVANALSSLDHIATCKLADELLGFHPGTKKNPGEKPHIEQYEGLNNGQKRMNAGNRIRAAWKSGEVEVKGGKLVAA